MGLWTEWEYGIGGRKPAKNWKREERGGGDDPRMSKKAKQRIKQMHHRRRNIWRIQALLVNKGHNIQAANGIIESAYGANQSMTAISEAIANDRKRYEDHGGLHPNFR